MKLSIIVVLCATIVPLTLLQAEPSAFGAGDISNPNPYGLTSNEKVVLQNKKNLHKVEVKSNNQANKVDSLRERIDGLQTIIESLSRKAHKNQLTIKALNKKNTLESSNSNKYQIRVSEITQKNAQNIQKIELLVSELNIVVEKIDANYVTREEFNKFVKNLNKSHSKSNKQSFKKMSNNKILKKAKYFFNKKYYTKSMEYFNYLIFKNYKPAYGHYMIGEMKFKRKKYDQAIAYYKKSVSLYDEAKYMPTLMLHTAVSMDKNGDKKNAKAFYKGVIVKYPQSNSAIKAKKYLGLL